MGVANAIKNKMLKMHEGRFSEQLKIHKKSVGVAIPNNGKNNKFARGSRRETEKYSHNIGLRVAVSNEKTDSGASSREGV